MLIISFFIGLAIGALGMGILLRQRTSELRRTQRMNEKIIRGEYALGVAR